MRFRYVFKREASEFAVAINCKGSNLRIDIDKTYSEENGQLFVTPFPRSRQDDIILAFQNAANSIYAKLRSDLDGTSDG
jgi:hypothetical protein